MAVVSKTTGSNPLEVRLLYPPQNETSASDRSATHCVADEWAGKKCRWLAMNWLGAGGLNRAEREWIVGFVPIFKTKRLIWE